MPKAPKKKAFQIKPVNLDSAYQSVCLYLLLRCKWKSNHFWTKFKTSETRQFQIASIYDGKPGFFTLLCCQSNCGSLSGMGRAFPGLNITRHYSVPQKISVSWGLPSCCSDTLLIKGLCLWVLKSQDRINLTVVFRVLIYFNDWTTFLFCGHPCHLAAYGILVQLKPNSCILLQISQAYL